MSSRDWNVEVDPVFGCWRWLGAIDSDGYPIEWRGGRPLKIYRVIFERETGAKVPEGLVLDHGCKVRRCCSSAHLDPVTQEENLRRRTWRYQVRRKTCKNGHDLSVTAQIMKGGGRVCRQCSRDLAEREAQPRPPESR